jgi:hypothetical protein
LQYEHKNQLFIKLIMRIIGLGNLFKKVQEDDLPFFCYIPDN